MWADVPDFESYDRPLADVADAEMATDAHL
jgi:hypothetical protein